MHKIKPNSAWALAEKVSKTRAKRGFEGSFDSTFVLISELADIEMKKFPASACGNKDFTKLEDKVDFILQSRMKREFLKRLLNFTPLDTHAGANKEFDKAAYGSLREKKSIRFLDAGSGFDNLSFSSPTSIDTVKFFQSHGLKIDAVAVDIAIPKELRGKEKGGVTYLNADISRPLVGQGKFDYVRCANVIWHYDAGKARDILQNLKMLLAEDGILLVGSSNGMEREIVAIRKADRIGDFF